MAERLSVACLICFLLFASSLAGTPTIIDNQTSKLSQQVRMMDYLRLYVGAGDPDQMPLICEWTITQDPTAKAYFTANNKTTFTGGGGVELAFPWISNSDAVNSPLVGQSVQVVVIVKHENIADGPETDSRTFNITISGINHPPLPVITGTLGTATDRLPSGSAVVVSSGSSSDPDPRDTYRSDWTVTVVPGLPPITPTGTEGSTMSFTIPPISMNLNVPIVLQLTDGMHRVRTTATAYLGPAGPPPPPPPPSPYLHLNNDRFIAEVAWSTITEASGVGRAVTLTPDSGYFWFFEPENLELLVKVLDGRQVNGHFWVFYGSLTDVRFTLKVTDTSTGAVKLYQGQQGLQTSGHDTSAF